MSESELEEFKEQFFEMRGDVYKIRTALLGDEFNHIGFIHRIELIEKQLLVVNAYMEQDKLRAKIREDREKRFHSTVRFIVGILTIVSLTLGILYFKK